MDISAPNSAWPLRSSSENMPVSQQEVSRLGVKLAEVFRKNIARKKPVFTDSPEDWLPRVPDLENAWEFLYVILTDVPKRVPGLHLLAGSALYAHRLCNEEALTPGKEDSQALRLAQQWKLMLQYIRALTRRSLKSKNTVVQILKNAVQIEPKPITWKMLRKYAERKRRAVGGEPDKACCV